MLSDRVQKKMTNYAEICGGKMQNLMRQLCRKKKTLDYAEISTVNKTDNKLTRLATAPNNRETKSNSKFQLQ